MNGKHVTDNISIVLLFSDFQRGFLFALSPSFPLLTQWKNSYVLVLDSDFIYLFIYWARINKEHTWQMSDSDLFKTDFLRIVILMWLNGS